MPLPPSSIADNPVSPLSVSLPLVPVTAKGSFVVTVSLFVSVGLLLGPAVLVIVCVVIPQPPALPIIDVNVRRHTRHHAPLPPPSSPPPVFNAFLGCSAARITNTILSLAVSCHGSHTLPAHLNIIIVRPKPAHKQSNITNNCQKIFINFLCAIARGWWHHVRPAPKDPIVSVNEAFLADPFPHKINLGIGTYRGDDGKPFVPQSVRDAETKIQRCKLEHFYPDSQMYLPDPTWSNHHNIWRQAEIPVKTFHYYHPDTKGLDFAALLNDVKNRQYALSFIGCFLSCLSDKSNTLYYHECTRLFFLLHPCAHNPTGVDPSEEKWREISLQFKAKNHFPFFDMAYQGFSSGDLDKDVIALRIFLEDGHLIGCAQSFAKNMGLSEHKAGCLRSRLNGFKLCQVANFLAVKQLEKLFHIYMTPDGRMSMSGVTSSNVDYLANAIHQVTRIDEEALRSC
ncbi:hypothetical protein JHK85_006433 [Glycine max]|nr:hypothetical protein JHK85_006433 [Glycine max]